MSTYVVIPTFQSPDVANVNFGGFLCDKYINSQPNARPDEAYPHVAPNGAIGSVRSVSKAGVPVWDNISFSRAMIACCNRGKGWHLMTPFEWASLSFLVKKYNMTPHGGDANTNPPSSVHNLSETAILDQCAFARNVTVKRALPGTGPGTWAHNMQGTGVYDLFGIVYQLTMGLMKCPEGYPLLPANDDLTYYGSPFGRGTLTGSGTATPTLTCDGLGENWMKKWTEDSFNGLTVFIAENNSFYNISDTNQQNIILTSGSSPGNKVVTFCIFKSVSIDITAGKTSGHKIVIINNDESLKRYALPGTTNPTGSVEYGNDRFYFTKTGPHKVMLRGGPWNLTDPGGGLFLLNTNVAVTAATNSVGFRACKSL